jgi:hypothetical protein
VAMLTLEAMRRPHNDDTAYAIFPAPGSACFGSLHAPVICLIARIIALLPACCLPVIGPVIYTSPRMFIFQKQLKTKVFSRPGWAESPRFFLFSPCYWTKMAAAPRLERIAKAA